MRRIRVPITYLTPTKAAYFEGSAKEKIEK